MIPAGSELRPIRVHATNITGEGASHLVQSLLPALERICGDARSTIYLPTRGPLSNYAAASHLTRLVPLRRLLPNSLSRVLECTVFSRQFAGEGPLLVLGDIPLRCEGPQIVFVQTLLLARSSLISRNSRKLKYRIARTLFRLNSRFVTAFIVQTSAMRDALAETYPEIAERIHVVGQPPPDWLLARQLRRTGKLATDSNRGLRLFYPAASYPHKNHCLLSQIRGVDHWPVNSLVLTIDQSDNPHPDVGWIRCVGRLSPDDVMETYAMSDALLFLSLTESFGFPLAEAMWIGIPIVCPDLPYARLLCGEEAVYFDPANIGSLHKALLELERRLGSGWWPDWTASLTKLPSSWLEVAGSMLRIARSPTSAMVVA